MSESLGVFGIISVDYKISKYQRIMIYLTYGFSTSYFWRYWLTYKKYFNSNPDKSKRSANPNLTSTIFKYYALALHGDDIASGTIIQLWALVLIFYYLNG